MLRLSTVIVLLFALVLVENQIYLSNTNDGLAIESYDCFLLQSLLYCRRPSRAINLTRDNDNQSCAENGGELHQFSDLRSKNITVSTILHQWRSTLERVEQYSLFHRDDRELDGSICQCSRQGSFGKDCEYQLPRGERLEETLEWQLIMRKENPNKMQIDGDVVCYQTLTCHSGALCLDWREICDGIQQCLEGMDEENCDLLEMNQCDEEEYRCANGMCIPDQFFLDGERDCLDWSDEIQFQSSEECPRTSVSAVCDDHLCPPNWWSCGDGECIRDRLYFQKFAVDTTCHSQRDQYFMCETHLWEDQWTMSNGRCVRGDRYGLSPVVNRSKEELCEYLLKCALSWGAEQNCPCYLSSECVEQLGRDCALQFIRYPREAIIAPFLFPLYNGTRNWRKYVPDSLLINGTVRCRDSLITVTKILPFNVNLDVRRMLEEHFCRASPSEIFSRSEILSTRDGCHHANESTDRCGEWNECFSVTRMNDGSKNCLDGSDEVQQTQMEIEESCARVRRHRFQCSAEQATCLGVMKLGSGEKECENGFDELWFGRGRTLSSIKCHQDSQGECSLLRQYIQQTETSFNQNDESFRSRMPFRSHCDTLNDFQRREETTVRECRRWWICPQGQSRCESGQCVEQSWLNDTEWDCADASDEYDLLKGITQWTLEQASGYNFTNRSYFVPSSCSHSDSFLCLSARATQQGFFCFNLSQISDGHIDCAGGIDERNTLPHCSLSSSVLGYDFLCPSTNTCIPYRLHCWDQNRCPNSSDDRFWCDRQDRSSDCSNLNDFVCFDGRCMKGGRCNRKSDCPFGEDEYMCDYLSVSRQILVPYRQQKRISQGSRSNVLRLPQYPSDVQIIQFDSHSQSISITSPLDPSSSPYSCHRGVGILTSRSESIVCFCPPHYFGKKCQYHQDRLSVLLHLDFPRSTSPRENHSIMTLKLLVVFFFNGEILLRDEFSLRTSAELAAMKKIITHFPYPRSSEFLRERRERFFNRSSLLHDHPFSIQIQLYQTLFNDHPSLMGVWNYPIFFDHLPVFRLAKVLHLIPTNNESNPCSSDPCHPNEQCQQLMNNRSQFVCLCPTNFSGENCSKEDQRCTDGYCGVGSLCQANSRSSPFCLCSLGRYGQRCQIEHDGCFPSPCQNNGSCFPDSHPDQVICVCRKDSAGPLCQWKRSSIRLSLSATVPSTGAVIQYFQIDFTALELNLLDQQASRTLPEQIEYVHSDHTSLPEIVVAKVYSSDVDLHLLSLQLGATSIDGRTEVSSVNRCEHQQTFSNVSSPIAYHQLCIDNPTRLCFRDDVYLCLCEENHSRVECFNYDDNLDRCEYCRANGRCLKGDPRRPTDFLCLCPECHSGQQCQFNSKPFSFTLDQLFSPDLLSARQERTVSLLIFFSLLGLIVAILNNLFSFVTVRRRSCLRQGVGHYLLWLSVINQLTFVCLTARLIHLTVIMTMFHSSPLVDDLFCKLLNYLLTCFTRLSAWLPSFVALERVYTAVFFNHQWFKQPHVARSLMLLIFVLILLSAAYELVFVKSFLSMVDGNSVMCVIDYPPDAQSMWLFIHQFVSVSHSLLPLLINLCSTLTIMIIVIKNKMNLRGNETHVGRGTIFRNVLNENREMITRPAVTLLPSLFSLFSLSFFIISFSLGCQNLDANPLRYLLLTFYFLTFLPQMLMFVLYIYPSSFYWKECQLTTISQRITALRQRQQPMLNITSLSTVNEHKTRDLSSLPKNNE